MFGGDAIDKFLLACGRIGSSPVPWGAIHRLPGIRRARTPSHKLHERATIASNEKLFAFTWRNHSTFSNAVNIATYASASLSSSASADAAGQHPWD